MQKIEAFRAYDGSLHETEEACRAYERRNPAQRIIDRALPSPF